MLKGLPLLPTTVCGSHALPSWVFLVREAQEAGRLGPVDLREAYDDAVRIAIRDQLEAGVDVVSDGEMRRITFIRGFYGRLTGIRYDAQRKQLRGDMVYLESQQQMTAMVKEDIQRQLNFFGLSHVADGNGT